MSKFIGVARSSREVRFYLRAERCPRCGERDIGQPKVVGGLFTSERRKGMGGEYLVTCPGCGTQRAVWFFDHPDYDADKPVGHLGGSEQSEIIPPHVFAKELASCTSSVERDLARDRKSVV